MQSYCLPCPPALRAVSQLFSILQIYLFFSCWCAPPQLWSTRKKAQQRWSDRRDGRATNAMNRSGDVVQHNAAQLTVVNLGIFSPTDANFLLHGYLLFHSSILNFQFSLIDFYSKKWCHRNESHSRGAILMHFWPKIRRPESLSKLAWRVYLANGLVHSWKAGAARPLPMKSRRVLEE